VKTIFGKWKVPIEYHCSQGSMSGDKLETIILKALKFCRDIKLNIRAIVTDQGTPNQKLYRNLGITVEKPYFHHSKNFKNMFKF
jgi:hypothetical protein